MTVVAVIVLLLCISGVVVGLNYIEKNEQTATPKDYAWLLLLLWGGVNAAGVLARRAWAHKSFMPWAIVTGLAWQVTVFYFGPFVLVGLILAALLVGRTPQAARVPIRVTEFSSGRIAQINVADGGVPKLPVPSARVTRGGVAGDRQRDLRYHGGPDRAVCCLALEVIERLRGEGHPIAPGSTGENLTLAGLDWPGVRPGVRLLFAGGVELEVTGFAAPCGNIRSSFRGGEIERLSDKLHPGEGRVYCRVLAEGELRTGESVQLANGNA